MNIYNIYGVGECIFSYLKPEELLYISLINKKYEKIIKNTLINDCIMTYKFKKRYHQINIKIERWNHDKLNKIKTIFPNINIIEIEYNDHDIIIKNKNITMDNLNSISVS